MPDAYEYANSPVFSILDGIAPNINLTQPTSTLSIPEYHEVTVEWEATDNIGLDSVHVFYSSNGITFSPVGSIMGDSTSFRFNIPMGITDSAAVQVVVTDVSGIAMKA